MTRADGRTLCIDGVILDNRSKLLLTLEVNQSIITLVAAGGQGIEAGRDFCVQTGVVGERRSV